MDRLLTRTEVEDRCRVSCTTLYRMMANGMFPRPVRIGKRAVRRREADVNAYLEARPESNGVRVSAHVPAVAATKQNAIVRRGMHRDMVVQIWEGVTIIPDEVTKARTGQFVITAVMLHAVIILHTDGFYKQQTQHT